MHSFPTDMEACCKASNRSVRATATLQYVFDVKSWLTPQLEEIHGHTVPHVFLFRRNAEGKAVMFTKHWSHQEWEPQEGLKLLKVPHNVRSLDRLVWLAEH